MSIKILVLGLIFLSKFFDKRSFGAENRYLVKRKQKTPLNGWGFWGLSAIIGGNEKTYDAKGMGAL
ncbi:MAG: hypothetical protein U0043_09640 [Streptococcus sp.]